MKHLQMDDILSRRKSIKSKPKAATEQTQELGKCLAKQLREVNDQTIDHLIKIALRHQPLNQENKLDILQIIACKTGVSLNKHVVTPFIDLLHCPQVMQLSSSWSKTGKNYFVLKGQVQLYEMIEGDKILPSKFNTQPQSSKPNKTLFDDEDLETYLTIEDFLKFNKEYKLVEEIGDFRSLGNILNPDKPESGLGQIKEKEQKRVKLIAIDAVLVQIKQIDRDLETVYNDGIPQDEKMEILNHFPVLRLIGKKLSSFINSFKLKQFSLKQMIYKHGDKPKSVYFIIKGEIGFELMLDQHQLGGKQLQIDPLNRPNRLTVNTETFGQTSYFGQEEILFKTSRTQTAKCISSKCMALELDKDKFDKLLENPEFHELVMKAAKVKKLERQKKIEKAKSILESQTKKTTRTTYEGLNETDLKNLTINIKTDNKKRFSSRRLSQNSVKVMHGNIIRDFPEDKEQIHFSMLEVNPDMYEAVKKKFRKYSVKPLVYDKRKIWDFKKVWKILNLEDVLREQEMEIASPEGRKFFDCHKRLMHQVNETKSIRPKTSSSNYRTKLQYIAYLQQFNN